MWRREGPPRRSVSVARLKYPSTPYWPYSPAIGRDERVHPAPATFVGAPVVATEKMDGTNTLIHDGQVYARSVATPSDAKWMAMVKKHHAWKVREPDVYLYGENIYAVHSIEYGPVAEQETFYAFALRDAHGAFASFGDLEAYAASRDIPTVPVLHRGLSPRWRRAGNSSTRPIGSHRRSAVRGRALCCGWRGDSQAPISPRTCARAFGKAMCRTTSIGLGTGDPVRSRDETPMSPVCHLQSVHVGSLSALLDARSIENAAEASANAR